MGHRRSAGRCASLIEPITSELFQRAMGRKSNGCLRTDKYEEAVSAIEAAADFAERVIDDQYRWKWVLIAVHNAVQGFMVLALRRGNGLLALRDHVAAQWL